MSKKIVTLIMAAAFTVGCAGVSLAAKKVSCEVKSVEGNTVTMECKNADDLKAGMNVKVSAAKKKAIEGC
jgi:outer membrane lipoprotein-sorting protein